MLENVFIALKKGKIGNDGEMSDGYVSVKNYLACEKISDNFNMKNYHNNYLKKDVLFLADVLEKFIDMCLNSYGLDPCHYFGSPGLSWDAMLKMTGVKLEKISGIDKYLFIKKRLRGGVSYIVKRHTKTNNKYTGDYNSKKLSTFITYLDMSNLCG